MSTEQPYEGYPLQQPQNQRQDQSTRSEHVPFEFAEKGLHIPPRLLTLLATGLAFCLYLLFWPGGLSGVHLVIGLIAAVVLFVVLQVAFGILRFINKVSAKLETSDDQRK